MLPDFPKIKNKLDQATYQYLIKNLHQTQILSIFPKKKYFEGNGFSIENYGDDKVETDPFKEIVSEFSLKHDEMMIKGPIAYIERILGIIAEMDDKGENLVLGKMMETTAKTGNEIQVNGKLTPDDILEMYDKIPVSFDENGNHELLFIVGSDDVKEVIDELKENPEYIKKEEKLIEKKRQEWDDRENNRKLVD